MKIVDRLLYWRILYKNQSNMRSLFSLMCIAFWASLCSCSVKEERQIPIIRVAEAETLVFPLDDSTVENMEHLQYFQRNDSNILAFTNEYDNSIVFYDYNSSKYLNRISYDKEGRNGIGSVFAFCYVNEDSIYHFHYNLSTLFRTNSKGKVLEKHLIQVFPNPSPDSLFLAPTLFPRPQSPMRLVGNEMLIPGFLIAEVEGENDKNRPVMTYFNLITHGVRHSDCYPSMYHNSNWGGDMTWRAVKYTMSPNGEFVLSFPADHNIRVRKQGEVDYKEYYAGVGDGYEIEPIEDKVVNFKSISPEMIRNHYIRNLTYDGIYYDKYREVYYRIAKLPDSDIDIHKRPIRKPIEVVVLNKDFQIIGKAALPSYKYWISHAFVGEKGLHIQIQSENEDELVFKTFVVK